MLRTMRKKLKFWSHLFLWPVIISFVAFYGWSFLDSPQQTNIAAVVGDTKISWREVTENRRRLHRYYRQLYKENFERFADNLDFNEMAMNRLVDQVLLNRISTDLGVTVSKQEIQKSILAIPAFQKNGAFSSTRYLQVLQRMSMTAAEYESSVASDIRLQKTRTLISAAAPVTEDELKQMFIDQNVKINCDFLQFKMPGFKDKVIETPEAIEAYYNANIEDFRIGDQILVDYIQFKPAEFEKDVEIFNIDVEDYYDQNFERYQEPEKIRASHILFKVENSADETTVDSIRLKAVAAFDRISKGETFADVAKEVSEGPTAPKGGDLGFFKKGQMDPTFEKAAWDLEIDEITAEPVRSRFGWHLITKTALQKQSWKSIEDVRPEIERSLRSDESKILAMSAAQNLFDKVEPGTSNLIDLTKENTYTIETSEFFEPGNTPRMIGYARELKDILSNLEEQEISIPVETIRGVFVFQLKATRESHIPQFEEVKESAVVKFKNGTATKLALAEAEKAREALLAGKTWDEISTDFAVESKNTNDFTSGPNIPAVGGSQEIVDNLFNLKINEISNVYEIRNNAVLFKLVERKDFVQADFEKEVPKLRQRILSGRQNQIVSSWLDQMKKELSRQNKFQVNNLTDFE
ncbi:SurA N-terminal domain-containing protein [bacterium]|nr:SurA N-terminal domain-containing protein [bacterium]